MLKNYPGQYEFERGPHMMPATSSYDWTTVLQVAEPVSVGGDAFRQALARLAAGVSIVTTIDQDGARLGLTATAVTSVSLDPPLVLVCIDKRSHSGEAIQDGAPFIIHFLADDQEGLARQFASRAPDKFAGIAYEMSEHGCPRLEGVLASVECVPYEIYPGGDHTICVGRVVDVRVSAADASPLVYFRSQFMHC